MTDCFRSKYVLGLSALAGAAAVGGVVVFSHYDPEFRQTVERNVPYSDVLLRSALGKR